MRPPVASLLWAVLAIAAGAAGAAPAADQAQLEKLSAELRPVEIAVDLSGLPKQEQSALAEIVRAAKAVEPIFMEQKWPGSLGMLLDLAADDSPEGRARLRFFLAMTGPWDSTDADKPFVPGAPAAPPVGGGFYPAHATKEQLESWLDRLPAASRERASSPLTVVRWVPGAGFGSVPYSIIYQDKLDEAAAHLRAAAAQTGDASLRAYLLQRTSDFTLDDFGDRGKLLLGLGSRILPIVPGADDFGMDKLLEEKAAFSGLVALRDEAETARVKELQSNFDWLMTQLPPGAPAASIRPKAPAGVVIADLLFAPSGASGEAGNIWLSAGEKMDMDPRDALVVMRNLKGILLKFHAPVFEAGLSSGAAGLVDLDAHLYFLVMNELLRDAAPQEAAGPFGERGGVGKLLKETYPLLERARKDAAALWALQRLIDRGVLDKGLERKMYATFVALSLAGNANPSPSSRTAAALELNYFIARGGVVVGRDGRLSIDEARIKDAASSLLSQIFDIEARGNYDAARKIVGGLGAVAPAVRRILDGVRDLPWYFSNQYVTADELLRRPSGGPEEESLRNGLSSLVEADLSVDISGLSKLDRAVLAELVRAAKVMDPIFLDQEWAGSQDMLLQLAQDQSPLGRDRLALFLKMKGPWNLTDGGKPFVPGAPAMPEGANLYPAGATRKELEAWIAALPEAGEAQARSPLTAIRRVPKAGFGAVPYSLIWENQLEEAASHLRAAAGLTGDAGLRAFLERRAEDFSLNDFYESEKLLLGLDSPVLPLIGPHISDMDQLLGTKSLFAGLVLLRDDSEAGRLKLLQGEFDWLVGQLPPGALGNGPKPQAHKPMIVANLLFASGAVAQGPLGAITMEPKDERLVGETGIRRILFKNVAQAQLRLVLRPMMKAGLSRDAAGLVDIDARLALVEATELMQGAAPQMVPGPDGSVQMRHRLKETYPAIERLRVDAAGLWALQRLIGKGVLEKGFEPRLHATFVAYCLANVQPETSAMSSAFRVELNFLLDRGAVLLGRDGRLSIDDAKMREAAPELLEQVLAIEGKGDRQEARKVLDQLDVVRPAVQRILDRRRALPVGLTARFSTAQALLSRY